MSIVFGPAGLGPVKTAVQTLETYHKLGLRACEIAFTYSAYIKAPECPVIREKAKELGIDLSIHAQYWLNLNSAEKEKREATKQRILQCCEIGELLGAKLVVFHPGYYGKDKEETYQVIKQGVLEIMEEIKRKGWKIQIAPETMGRVNVFGGIEEISRLVRETGCAFCIDFAHILAREKKVDYDKIDNLFPQKEWHVHFSGIVYGEKGEKHHITTGKKEWKELLENLPKDRKIRIVNESPTLVDDSVEGMKIWSKLTY
ncbi:MAG TPA: TIM barrel protein [Candidatus Nanoarchaeia archaeon]|nr:TIM barrel protein [Candidatus Nanoarchaeia archaeon]